MLLTTNWHQGDPFNWFCPAPPEGDDCMEARCAVGCVATAAAQIMRYWHWPPYSSGSGGGDTFDWTNMPDDVTEDSPVLERGAVSDLSTTIGDDVGMDYCGGDGCGSSAYITDMDAAYEDHYYYSPLCSQHDRISYSAVDWFNLIKVNINENRPVQYQILGHSIVGDGWQEIAIGTGIIREYHMNYGWGMVCDTQDGCNTWYTLDAIYQIGGGGPNDENMLVNILPVTSVLHTIAGVYPTEAFNFRYFDQDASGSSATFAAGQNLQFLPDIVVRSTGTIKFGGSSRFFTRGDTSRGIRTDSGGISMYSGGQMTLY